MYCRISKDEAGAALGVDRQQRLCRELAERRGLDVIAVHVDNDISAYNGAKRPGLVALTDDVRSRRIEAILVYHVDRLYRRVTELEKLVTIIEDTKVDVLTVSAGDLDLRTASGRMVARLLATSAQAESERMGERLRAKSDELARAGKHPGGKPPYGYSKGYIVNEDEARWLRWAADRAFAGWSLVRIARGFDENGVATREGKPWHHSTIAKALANPAVAGLRVHRREIAGPGEWEPIFDREAWERLRATVADPARRKQRTGGPYLLSGLVYSPHGDKMNGRVRALYTGTIIRSYATKQHAAVSVEIKAEPLEAAVTEAILLRFDGVHLPHPEQDDTATAELSNVEAELAELARLRGEGVIGMGEWLAAREPLQRRVDEARAAVVPARSLPAVGDSIRKVWPTLDVAQRQAIIRAVIRRIVVRPAGRRRNVPLEDRVTVGWIA